MAELDGYWQTLELRRLSLTAAQLADVALPGLIAERDYAIESVTHVFVAGALSTGARDMAMARDDLMRTIDRAARLGARSVYMLTGGRGARSWEAAAELFCVALLPCVRAAEQAGVALAIENASSLYVDIHLAHTLRDTITLAEMAGIGICIDHFHCWTEAGFAALVARALPRTRLIQLSDHVPGDRALPARAVPGDGVIPIAPFIAQALAGGYANGFDIELIGPRIDREGRLAAAARACSAVGAMLDELGA